MPPPPPGSGRPCRRCHPRRARSARWWSATHPPAPAGVRRCRCRVPTVPDHGCFRAGRWRRTPHRTRCRADRRGRRRARACHRAAARAGGNRNGSLRPAASGSRPADRSARSRSVPAGACRAPAGSRGCPAPAADPPVPPRCSHRR
ncbi:hypothetical protein G6F68_013822 [Rhizopus microsporus]|nr:hypothetical protein G6F68_013822 [Rhizopus microsporus]